MWSAGLWTAFPPAPYYFVDLSCRRSVGHFGESVRYAGSIELPEQADSDIFSSRVKTFRARLGGEHPSRRGSRFEIETALATLGTLAVNLCGALRAASLLRDRSAAFSASNRVGIGGGVFCFDAEQPVS